jgi:hypothetical protein
MRPFCAKFASCSTPIPRPGAGSHGFGTDWSPSEPIQNRIDNGPVIAGIRRIAGVRSVLVIAL